MTQAEYVPITGEVLRWAISESGYSDQEVARNVQVSLDVLLSWIAGSALPNRTQFRGLAKVLRLPQATFFLPRPPETEAPSPQFRSAPGNPAQRLLPDERYWIRAAHDLQLAASNILQLLDRAPAALPRYSISDAAEAVSEIERKRLGVTLADQLGWANDTEAYLAWRDALERTGVLTFQFPIGDSLAPGFCLFHEYAPLIVTNARYNLPRRIYTLFHEYAHLLLASDDTQHGAPNRTQATGIRNTERWCEVFAASFLLPRVAVERLATKPDRYGQVQPIACFGDVANIAEALHVSVQATARRLHELRLVSEEVVASVDAIATQAQRSSGGPRYSRAQIRSIKLGRLFPEIIVDGVAKQVFHYDDALAYSEMTAAELSELVASATR